MSLGKHENKQVGRRDRGRHLVQQNGASGFIDQRRRGKKKAEARYQGNAEDWVGHDVHVSANELV